MSTPTIGPSTREDLDRMPDDGNRYELIEGEIVMSPSPRMRHQVIAANLFTLLREACPENLLVLFAPFDVALEERSVVVPDLIVFDQTVAAIAGEETWTASAPYPVTVSPAALVR
ncbi:Uma2 family endonuclease [Nocardioides sp. AE5]|uniref:Uma2 family endonuclease n=1 Tax=Nocardioides sp. AE5 TaxID=2962573 RepID=UPI002881330B|nr:Uma2 family endonuclease [Nocardioides sp. AE5]MDT0200356.1 Uma2 family endonuclease [Nocardioides sp. AE5]